MDDQTKRLIDSSLLAPPVQAPQQNMVEVNGEKLPAEIVIVKLLDAILQQLLQMNARDEQYVAVSEGETSG